MARLKTVIGERERIVSEAKNQIRRLYAAQKKLQAEGAIAAGAVKKEEA